MPLQILIGHGFSGCDTDWFTNAPLGEIANRFNVNFFMPNGDNNFYLDQPQTGCKYASYVGKEFVDYTRKTFGLSDRREDTFIGGLSMGGFGSYAHLAPLVKWVCTTLMLLGRLECLAVYMLLFPAFWRR